MLPLSLLNAAQGQPLMIELKSGETLNGQMVSCDTWMNLTLKEVIQTSSDGQKFVKLPEMYVRGNVIKYMRVPEVILDQIKEDRQNRKMEQTRQQQAQRGNRNNRQNYNNPRGGGGGGGNWRQNRGGGNFNNNRRYQNQGQTQNQ